MTKVKLTTCAFGELFLGSHPVCQAHVAEVCGVSLDEVVLPDYSVYARPVVQELQQEALPL